MNCSNNSINNSNNNKFITALTEQTMRYLQSAFLFAHEAKAGKQSKCSKECRHGRLGQIDRRVFIVDPFNNRLGLEISDLKMQVNSLRPYLNIFINRKPPTELQSQTDTLVVNEAFFFSFFFLPIR